MIRDGSRRGQRHVADVAPVIINVPPLMISQDPLRRERLEAVRAAYLGGFLLLPQEVILQLAPRRERQTAPRAPDDLLFRVNPRMFAEFVGCFDLGRTTYTVKGRQQKTS